jgi:hypothetical protein
MPFAVEIHNDLPYLLVRAQGPATLADLCGAADLVATVARMNARRRALVDLLATEQHLPFTEHLQLGTYVAQALASLERVATVITSANRSGASEKAAQKSGLKLRTFLDLEEARHWILEA